MIAKFYLDILLKIVGIGSASGLFYKDNAVFVVSDNSVYLYKYDIPQKSLSKALLLETVTNNLSENIGKEFKFDFESIVYYEDIFYIFGSGSKSNRNLMLRFDNQTKITTGIFDLTRLYEELQSAGGLEPEGFNIEGAVFTGSKWFLFNRGNGKLQKNGIFTIAGESLADKHGEICFNVFKLPKIKGVDTSFTDAVEVDHKIYFLATAENTKSTYEDGAVLGSIIGRIDVDKMTIDFTTEISGKHKFEGITAYKKDGKQIEFLLSEDPDNEIQESTIYRLRLDQQ